MTHNLGSIYTPTDFADFLTSWAVRNPTDKVLDLGIGEGVFAFTAYEKLKKLGASKTEAQNQIYGAEINKVTFKKFLNRARQKGLQFSNLHQTNFFQTRFPQVDCIIGNPPYVRRSQIRDIEKIRTNVFSVNRLIEQSDLKRLTDLYVYFLLHALPLLKPEGCLATILADSWLNVGYGSSLKKYLTQEFEINQLISFDRRVFHDAQVKPVLLLATRKGKSNSQSTIAFIRVKNGLPISTLKPLKERHPLDDVTTIQVPSKNLKIDQPWGLYFKAPEVYKELSSHKLMKPITKLANTRIGVQTLAKRFFVLTLEQVQTHQIEPEFLQPLAQSVKYVEEPTIDPDTPHNLFVFYCSMSKEELKGTKALEYILKGESTEIEVRGKNEIVMGYQNKKRIQQARRLFWYDLKTDIERRGRAVILIPRLVYRTFKVVWNRANYVPGELFIEFLPREIHPNIEAHLAVLISTPTEIMMRIHAQVYGGGTYNINPGQIKKVPILDVTQLPGEQKTSLSKVYRQYLADSSHNRTPVNEVVYQILGFDIEMQNKLNKVLEDLVLIATSSKQPSA